MRLFGAFLLLSIGLEIWSIVLMIQWLGGMVSIILMILGFLAGKFLLRGQNNIAQIMLGAAMMRGSIQKVSLYQMLWPVRIPFAGLLFMFPGFLSSILAIILLLPFKGSEKTISAHSTQQTFNFDKGKFHYQDFSRRNANDDDIIEGDFVVHEDVKKTN